MEFGAGSPVVGTRASPSGAIANRLVCCESHARGVTHLDENGFGLLPLGKTAQSTGDRSAAGTDRG